MRAAIEPVIGQLKAEQRGRVPHVVFVHRMRKPEILSSVNGQTSYLPQIRSVVASMRRLVRSQLGLFPSPQRGRLVSMAESRAPEGRLYSDKLCRLFNLGFVCLARRPVPLRSTRREAPRPSSISRIRAVQGRRPDPCRQNGRQWQSAAPDALRRVYVQSAAGDAGRRNGAAIHICHRLNGGSAIPASHASALAGDPLDGYRVRRIWA
jgi:hypothetical protein